MASLGPGRSVDVAQRGADARVGRFRYWFDADRWEWSDEVAVMHGYRPGEVIPTTELMISHKHPADREGFVHLVQRMRLEKTPFSSRHRIIAVGGRVRNVIVLGRTFSESGSVVGTEGFYLDVGDVVDESVRGRVADHVQHFRENGAVIEQAKGMLMVVYGVDAERAFDVLRWVSQTRNVAVHEVSRAVVNAAAVDMWVPENERRMFDLLMFGSSDDTAEAGEAAGH